jgi:hypothetical protein
VASVGGRHALIHFPASEVDLGEVPLSAEGVPAVFRFVNRGLADLELGPVEVKCRCLKAEATHKVLEPGAEGLLRILVRADEPGALTSGVVVHSNDPVHPATALSIAWRTVMPVELEPWLLDFGDVLPGSRQAATLHVRHNAPGEGKDSCRIARMEAVPSDLLTIEAAAFAQGSCDVQVELRADSALGVGEGVILARLEGCWADELRVPVRWWVRDVIEAVPSRLLLGVGFAGQKVESTLVVTSRGADALSVANASLSEDLDWVSATPHATSDGVVLVRLSGVLPDVPGVHAGELVVECSAPESRTLRVPVGAHVRSVDPDEEAGLSSARDQSPAASFTSDDEQPAASSPTRRTEP